jgi:TPR repeat protein
VKRNLKETLRLYWLASNQEHARAQFNLARLLEAGVEADPDMEDAVRYYTRAAQKGHTKAREALERIGRAGS